MAIQVGKLDVPAQLSGGESFLSDKHALFFRKDSKIPTSFVKGTTRFVLKNSYTPTATGIENEDDKEYYAYEESVNDIGGGIFRVNTKYAKVPETHYTLEVLNIPYLKFRGVSSITGGAITINTAYLFNFLNVQSIKDVKFFNEDGFTSEEEKGGTINVSCRVKHEYQLLEINDLASGNLDGLQFEVSSEPNSFGDGLMNCGYIGGANDPIVNVNIDSNQVFTFSSANPSPKVRIASGVYAGNIYFKKTFQIIQNVVV